MPWVFLGAFSWWDMDFWNRDQSHLSCLLSMRRSSGSTARSSQTSSAGSRDEMVWLSWLRLQFPSIKHLNRIGDKLQPYSPTSTTLTYRRQCQPSSCSSPPEAEQPSAMGPGPHACGVWGFRAIPMIPSLALWSPVVPQHEHWVLWCSPVREHVQCDVLVTRSRWIPASRLVTAEIYSITSHDPD